MNTTLYRFYDAADDLLYVGIAGNPGRRFNEHCKDKAWWGEVVRSTMEHFCNRQAAEIAERVAIRHERPRYNVVYNAYGCRVPSERSDDNETPAQAVDRAVARFTPSPCPNCGRRDSGCRSGRHGGWACWSTPLSSSVSHADVVGRVLALSPAVAASWLAVEKVQERFWRDHS